MTKHPNTPEVFHQWMDPLFEAREVQRGNVVHALFRFAFPAQPCRICLGPLDVAADTTTYEVDVDNRNIGFRHVWCPKEGSEDAV